MLVYEQSCPEIPFSFNLYMSTSSNVLDLSKNAPQTSLHISWVINRSWLIHESPLFKSWLVERYQIIFVKHLNILLYNGLSSIFPVMGSKDNGTVIFQYFLISFFVCRNNICCFPFKRKFSTFKTLFKC